MTTQRSIDPTGELADGSSVEKLPKTPLDHINIIPAKSFPETGVPAQTPPLEPIDQIHNFPDQPKVEDINPIGSSPCKAKEIQGHRRILSRDLLLIRPRKQTFRTNSNLIPSMLKRINLRILRQSFVSIDLSLNRFKNDQGVTVD